MKRVSEVLADYVIKKGIVDEADREVYEYGFMITIELGLFILLSLSVSLCLHMVLEGILFFVIFVPLRTYAGGLHLDKFHSCFILSCLTFSGILVAVENIHISIVITFVILVILELCVYVLYPVENINRKIDNEEDVYFERRLIGFLLIDLVIAGLFSILKYDRYLLLIAITYTIVVVTMAIGKYKNAIDDTN